MSNDQLGHTHELIHTKVNARQWFNDGDHKAVRPYCVERGLFRAIKDVPLSCCGKVVSEHGHVDIYLVCPGDWVIFRTGADNRIAFEVMKPVDFAKKYQEIVEA